MVAPDRAERHNDAAGVVGGSGLVRGVEHFFEGTVRAWRSSSVRTGLIALVGGLPPTTTDVVRFIGWVALSASVTHIALVGFARLLAPPLSGVGWLLAVPLAVVCIARPDAAADAWIRVRRHGSRLGATK
jgi:hypothetical protein